MTIKKNQTVYYYNLFGIKQSAKVKAIHGNEVEVSVIHPDDADYDYDPDFSVCVRIDKLVGKDAPALRPLKR